MPYRLFLPRSRASAEACLAVLIMLLTCALAGQSITLNKSHAAFPGEGGWGEIRVTGTATPVSQANWIVIEETRDLGNGSFDLVYRVAAQSDPANRTGTIQIGTEAFTITQYRPAGEMPLTVATSWQVPGLKNVACYLNRIATSGDAGLQLWNEQGTLLATLTADTTIQKFYFSDKGLYLIADDGRIWEMGGYSLLPQHPNLSPETILDMDMPDDQGALAVATPTSVSIIDAFNPQQVTPVISGMEVIDIEFIQTDQETVLFVMMPKGDVFTYKDRPATAFDIFRYKFDPALNQLNRISGENVTGMLDSKILAEGNWTSLTQPGGWVTPLQHPNGESFIRYYTGGTYNEELFPGSIPLGLDGLSSIYMRQHDGKLHQYQISEGYLVADYGYQTVFQKGRLIEWDPATGEVRVVTPVSSNIVAIPNAEGKYAGGELEFTANGNPVYPWEIPYGSNITVKALPLEPYKDLNAIKIGSSVVQYENFFSLENLRDSLPISPAQELKEQLLTLNKSAIGAFSITATANGTSFPGGGIDYGTEVTLQMTVPNTYTFLGWAGDLAGNQNPVTLRVLGDKAITPVVAPNSITVNLNPANGGTVSWTPQRSPNLYAIGETVNFTATPATGHTFVRWEGGLSSTNPQTSAVISGPLTATAVFQPNPHTLSTRVTGGNGRVDSTYASTTTPVLNPVYYGSLIKLTAIPDPGYTFVRWVEDGNTQVIRNVTITGDVTYTAEFKVSEFTLGLSQNNGQIVASPSQQIYQYGTQVTLSGIPLVGYRFIQWNINEGGSSRTEFANPLILSMSANTTVSMTTQLKTYSLIRVAQNGSIVVSPDQPIYNHGTEVTTTAVAAPFHHFSHWTLTTPGGFYTSGETKNPVQFAIDDDYTLTASFAYNPVGPDQLFLEQDWFDAGSNTAQIGHLLAVDPDPADILTYSLVPGPGSTDNNLFSISGSILSRNVSQTSSSGKDEFQIRVRVDDRAGNGHEEIFTIRKIRTNLAVRFNHLNTFTQDPSFVNVFFQMTDPDGRGINLPEDLFRQQPGLLQLAEGGGPLSPSESFVQVAKVDEVPFALKTVLLIDNSFSVFPNLAEIKAAAKSLIPLLISGQEVAVYQFSETWQMLQDFTTDPVLLETAIDSINRGSPSTNLYGSIHDVLDPAIVNWEERFDASGIESGFLIVLTDGSDQTGIRSLEEVVLQRDFYRKRIFTIGLGNEIVPSVLQEIGNAGYRPVAQASGLGSAFTSIQEDIRATANSLYWLNYASPKRGDANRELTVHWNGNAYNGAGSFLSTGFNSNGFFSVQPGVFLERNAFNSQGLSTLLFQPGEVRDVRADTLLSSYQPEYVWTVDNGSLFRVVPWPDRTDRVLIQSRTTAGSTQLHIEDTPNFYSTSVVLDHVQGFAPVPAAVDLGNGIWNAPWFGIFAFNPGSDWIYHFNLGWLYIISAQPGELWIFDPTMGWGYTTPAAFPYLYFPSQGTWFSLI